MNSKIFIAEKCGEKIGEKNWRFLNSPLAYAKNYHSIGFQENW
jgi:hypothetical protein